MSVIPMKQAYSDNICYYEYEYNYKIKMNKIGT
jgi:hypothetical protein